MKKVLFLFLALMAFTSLTKVVAVAHADDWETRI